MDRMNGWKIIKCPMCQSKKFHFEDVSKKSMTLKCKKCGHVWNE